MPARRLPPIPTHAISRVDRRGMLAWRVHIKRRREDHVWLFHDHEHGGRTGALRAARAWHYRALQTLPPPLHTSSHDVRSKTGEVGVSLMRLRRRSGAVYSAYRAVWPLSDGRYKKRSFSVLKHGKRVAFKLAVKTRKQGLARLAEILRERIQKEIARRRAR